MRTHMKIFAGFVYLNMLIFEAIFSMATPQIRKSAACRAKNRKIRENILNFIVSSPNPENVLKESIILPEVLIPCYNHGKYVKDALLSVPTTIPVTIINDASTDDTDIILKKLSLGFAFRLVQNIRNLGQAGSLNKAIHTSPNNLFIILNADDIFIHGAIETLLFMVSNESQVRMVGGSCIPFHTEAITDYSALVVNPSDAFTSIRLFQPQDAKTYSRLNDLNLTMSGCTFFRSAWESVGGFFEFHNRVCSPDDRDFQMRVNALFPVAVTDQPLCLYRLDSTTNRGEYVG